LLSETFSDDTTIYFEITPENLRITVKYLREFAIISVLQCNIDKTSVIPLGSELDITDDNILCPDLELAWETEFAILGFTVDNKVKVKALITKWRSYNLSVNGRVAIAKSFLLSQYTYIGSVLDKVSENHFKGIQKTLCSIQLLSGAK
jgi:hypothetical protein